MDRDTHNRPPPPPQPKLMESLVEDRGDHRDRGRHGALLTWERPSRSGHPVFIGKHKLAASVSALHTQITLNTQITLIQDELKELETIAESSLVCKEILWSAESVPDPLIPEARGPADPGWDQWFRGDHHPRRHKRWI